MKKRMQSVNVVKGCVKECVRELESTIPEGP